MIWEKTNYYRKKSINENNICLKIYLSFVKYYLNTHLIILFNKIIVVMTIDHSEKYRLNFLTTWTCKW